MARQSKRSAAIQLQAMLKKGPSFSATFLHLDGFVIPEELRPKLEAEFARQYRIWQTSRIESQLAELLKTIVKS